MLKRDALRLIAGSALSMSAVAILAACSEKKAQFRGVDVTGADYARDLPLPDHNGQMRSLRDFRGKAVVVFFGYTQCPDVCPTSLQELVDSKQLLGAEGEGMRRLTRENCDQLVKIPMHGTVESLNVSVAAGVCLFEARRRLS